jgi:hypothetical protein
VVVEGSRADLVEDTRLRDFLRALHAEGVARGS